MTDAPERIWINVNAQWDGFINPIYGTGGLPEYTRSDLIPAMILAAVEAERERLQSDRPFIMGANHGYDTAMDQVVEEAQRFAEMYPQSSDGRNTFEIFAEWARRMKDGPAFDAAIRGPKP